MVRVLLFVALVATLIVVAAKIASADGLGSSCDSMTDCTFVDPTGTYSNCDPSLEYCVFTCPICGAGNVCTVYADDPNNPGHALEDCEGPQCGNGNTVCDPAMICDGQADCTIPCTVNGATFYRPGKNCEARGLFTEKATGRCFVPCDLDECAVLGDNYCGTVDQSLNVAAIPKHKRPSYGTRHAAANKRRLEQWRKMHPDGYIPGIIH